MNRCLLFLCPLLVVRKQPSHRVPMVNMSAVLFLYNSNSSYHCPLDKFRTINCLVRMASIECCWVIVKCCLVVCCQCWVVHALLIWGLIVCAKYIVYHFCSIGGAALFFKLYTIFSFLYFWARFGGVSCSLLLYNIEEIFTLQAVWSWCHQHYWNRVLCLVSTAKNTRQIVCGVPHSAKPKQQKTYRQRSLSRVSLGKQKYPWRPRRRREVVWQVSETQHTTRAFF